MAQMIVEVDTNPRDLLELAKRTEKALLELGLSGQYTIDIGQDSRAVYYTGEVKEPEPAKS